jgi:putative ubiquitin-RnfH superfamily antitoxin RatB of RatAB toxin-antitoxin module
MSSIRVEVVHARRDGVDTVTVQLPAGALVRDALRASGIDADASAVGVFGKRVRPDTPLADGDRVEIYRPLVLDPKERRRQRARKRVKSRTTR